METFITIIGAIFGILGIILFFKIWGATNDIAEIKKILASHYNVAVMGKYENAQKKTRSQTIEGGKEPSFIDEYVELEPDDARELAELEVMISGLSSDDKKYSMLNKFLKRHGDELVNTTTVFNMKKNHQRWFNILNAITPLYSNISRTIPSEFDENYV